MSVHIVLIRGPFGRNAWTMQLRHLPRSKSGTKYHAPNPGRPVPMNDMPMRHEVEQKFFPDGVERIPSCVADYSIPTLDAVIQKVGSKSTSQLVQLLENQTIFEKLAWAETESSDDSLGHAQESEPPSVCHEFQAARLFLSHFGFISMDNQATNLNSDMISSMPLLTILDTKRPGFSADLGLLDKLSPRTNDTLHLFYVKVGQSSATEIIDNMSEENVVGLNKHFWNMLMSLGWPVDVEDHAGWTGSTSTSWRIRSGSDVAASKKEPNLNVAEDLKFNGEKRVLYWADVGSEIAFVVPTKWNKCDDAADGSCLSLISSSSTDSDKSHVGNYERSISATQQSVASAKGTMEHKLRTLSLELDPTKPQGSSSNSVSNASSADPIAPSRRRTCAMKPAISQNSGKFLVVWLESFEDHINFPTGKLLVEINSGHD